MLNTKSKHGIGWMGMGHAACNYGLPRKGMCFVYWTYKPILELPDGTKVKDIYERWKRMTIKRAKKENRKIIKCCVKGCKCNAKVLSHYWPSGEAICDKHYNK